MAPEYPLMKLVSQKIEEKIISSCCENTKLVVKLVLNEHLCRMVKNFTIELADTQFRFNTLSSSTLQVFQVYVPRGPKQQRFHMQRKGDVFFITDPAACPPEYLNLEADLSAAIFNSQPTPSGAR